MNIVPYYSNNRIERFRLPTVPNQGNGDFTGLSWCHEWLRFLHPDIVDDEEYNSLIGGGGAEAVAAMADREPHQQTNSQGIRRRLRIVVDNYGGVMDDHVKLANAVFHNDYDTVHSLLVEQGLKPSNTRAANPVIMAATDGRDRILALLLDHGWDAYEPDRTDFMWFRKPIHLAASQGHLNCISVLLDRGVDVNCRDSDHRSPLHWSCTYGRTEAAELLISRGASVNIAQSDGFTPLHAASCLNHNATCQLLLDRGADVNQADRDNWTALHTAACYGYIDVVLTLLEAGARVHQLTSDLETPFQVACSSGHLDIVTVLYEHGAQINRKNINGYTPFHLSVYYNKYNVARFLVSVNAEINTVNNAGQTVLQLAIMRGEEKFVRLMLDAGCVVRTDLNFANASISSDLKEEIEFLAANPRSLKQQSCAKIRSILSRAMSEQVPALPLPEGLKDLILFKHISST